MPIIKKVFPSILFLTCLISTACVHQVVTVPAQTAAQGAQTTGQAAQQVVSTDEVPENRNVELHQPISQTSAPK